MYVTSAVCFNEVEHVTATVTRSCNKTCRHQNNRACYTIIHLWTVRDRGAVFYWWGQSSTDCALGARYLEGKLLKSRALRCLEILLFSTIIMKWHIAFASILIFLMKKIIGGALAQPATPLRGPLQYFWDHNTMLTRALNCGDVTNWDSQLATY